MIYFGFLLGVVASGVLISIGFFLHRYLPTKSLAEAQSGPRVFQRSKAFTVSAKRTPKVPEEIKGRD